MFNSYNLKTIVLLSLFYLCVSNTRSQGQDSEIPDSFKWKISPPLLSPAVRTNDPCYSVKDPSVVYYNGRWHLFCTIRSQKRTHQIEYLSFEKWESANTSRRYILQLTDGYFCAPQVFYFTPHKKWYLIYQVIDPSRKPSLQPAFSTTTEIDKPDSWSKPTLLFSTEPTNITQWIDFWVICDDKKAHLFFTSMDGRMWRSETEISNFPEGWSQPVVVLRSDIFEASHTYKIKGKNLYLTIVEAQNAGRRYYKAYTATTLDGQWKPLADSLTKPFAGVVNTTDTALHWTDSFSHGEILRVGYDEKLEIKINGMKFLFQGVSDKERQGKSYGEIPLRLGILTLENR
ncbi:MAG: non-reducing end alpha-L-arabinofuranosidase family hydrolase [Verrucomicrobiia bacterium]